MKRHLFLLLLCLTVVAEDDWGLVRTPAPVAKGREWWVSSEGDDGGGGTRARPYRTITKALQRADPGDVIQVRRGRYTGEKEKLNFAKSGRPDAWIVLRSADGPGLAEIDGEGTPSPLVTDDIRGKKRDRAPDIGALEN